MSASLLVSTPESLGALPESLGLVPELLGVVPEPLGVVAAAILVPLALAIVVYLDARRRSTASKGRVASLTPLAWGATTFFSGAGCVVVAACYVAVTLR